jgi:hypothetical protein
MYTWSIASHGKRESVLDDLKAQKAVKDAAQAYVAPPLKDGEDPEPVPEKLDDASSARFDEAMVHAIEKVTALPVGSVVAVGISGNGDPHHDKHPATWVKKVDPWVETDEEKCDRLEKDLADLRAKLAAKQEKK